MWFADKGRDRTLAFLREHGLVNVVVDEPAFQVAGNESMLLK